VTNCFFRNKGDDGMAMWFARGQSAQPPCRRDSGNVFDHNTIQTPVLGNCIAI